MMATTLSKNILLSIVMHMMCITFLLLSGFQLTQTYNKKPLIKANEMVFTIETASAFAPAKKVVHALPKSTPPSAPSLPEKKQEETKPIQDVVKEIPKPEPVIVKKAIKKIAEKPKKIVKKLVKKPITKPIKKKVVKRKIVRKAKAVKTAKVTHKRTKNITSTKSATKSKTAHQMPTATYGTKSKGTKATPAASQAPTFNTASHIASIKQRIAQHKYYPNSAKRRGIEGRVGMQLSVAQNGTIKSLHIVQSSGSKTLDKAAIKSVRNAVPFRKMAKVITFRFFMNFKVLEG